MFLCFGSESSSLNLLSQSDYNDVDYTPKAKHYSKSRIKYLKIVSIKVFC